MALTPVPGSSDEIASFERLQQKLPDVLRVFDEDPMGDHVVVVVPSASMDEAELAKVHGIDHYEERLLVELLLLRRPRTRVVYCTSQIVPDTIVDYYLHLLAGVPPSHSRPRLTMLACEDSSIVPLTRKILDRPLLMDRIRKAVGTPSSAHLVCYNTTPLERTLAVQLGIALFGNDPAFEALGTKSGSRDAFEAAGVSLPDGAQHLLSVDDVIDALTALLGRRPKLRRAVVKLEVGFSGEGNAVVDVAGLGDLDDAARHAELAASIATRMTFVAEREDWESFSTKIAALGAVAEEYVESDGLRSPSVQLRILPSGNVEAVSTHDQVLDAATGQVYKGATFPADAAYRLQIQDEGLAVARVLSADGALGRVAIDFVVAPQSDGTWRSYAIEINLRKGGTTHPMLTLEMLTDGTYDSVTGEYTSASGRTRAYFVSDTLEHEVYRGLSVDDMIDIAVRHGLHYNPLDEAGVVLHMMGAVSEYGKFGATVIGDTVEEARTEAQRAQLVIDREVGVDEGEADT